MVTTGAGVYLHIPGESPQRVLHPGTAGQADDHSCTIELDAEAVPVIPGEPVIVYFDHGNQFMQQPGTVEAVMDDGMKIVVGLELTGAPISAETRQCYRVSAITTDVSCIVGDEANCPLVDISLTGFSVLATEAPEQGRVIDVSIGFEGLEYEGRACVQSVVPRGADRIRIGLHCVDDHQAGGTLLKGLKHMTMQIQRRQLQRRRGRSA